VLPRESKEGKSLTPCLFGPNEKPRKRTVGNESETREDRAKSEARGRGSRRNTLTLWRGRGTKSQRWKHKGGAGHRARGKDQGVGFPKRG